MSSVNFGSPQPKISVPSKIMMNQTVVGFNRAGPQQSTKSDGRKIMEQHAQTQNPVAKIYLEQMEKIYTKRTESTGQTRGTDSLTNYAQAAKNSHGGAFETLNQSAIHQKHYQVIRATQSQSPKSKGLNMGGGGINGMATTASAGLPNQTFYMAERLKRNNPMHLNRPSSLDESSGGHGNMIIHSTNDSRIQEMLPTVERQQQNRSVQMRSTMYSNNSQNANYLTKINALISNKKEQSSAAGAIPINILDQKKQDGSLMVSQMNSTMYNSGPQAYLNNSVITKALAQTKVRKYRAQIKQLNNSSMMQDANDSIDSSQPAGSGGYNMYPRPPKKGPRVSMGPNATGTQFSNRVAASHGNQSYDYGTADNTSVIQTEKIVNNSFTAAPNSTASRFYNPHKHNRFLSNNYPAHSKPSGAPIFQNNFVLPISYNSALTKTFYGSSTKPSAAQSSQQSNTQAIQQKLKSQSPPPPLNSNLQQATAQDSYQSTATTSQTGYQQKDRVSKQMHATMVGNFSSNANKQRVLII